MKRLMAIPALVLILASINFTILTRPSSSSAAMAAQGQPFFSIDSIEVTEGPGAQAVFTVSLTYQGGFRDFSSSVSYTTMNGTASSPSDYQQASGTVSFPPGPNPGGTASMTVSIPIVDDSETEGDETFTVVLSNPRPAFALSPATGACTIREDDGGPSSIVILDEEVSEGDGGTTDAVFRVGLNGAPGSGVSVDFATENLSAVAGSDYSSRAGTVTIPAGQRSADIVVPIVGDTLPELTQGFIVRLSNAQGAQIQDGEAVGVIIDNDDPETITVCSSDTPKQSQAVDFSSRIDSVVNIDRDLIVDDMDVRLFITNQTDPFFGNLSLSAELSKAPVSDGFGESLFRSLLLLPQTTIGTRCSPVPDFAIRDGAARRLKDHRGEVPYIGEWRNPVSLGLPFEGQGARGAWHLTINGFLVNTVFGPSRSRYTLECWCLTVSAPREGLQLEPSRATLPVFEGIGGGSDDLDFDDEDGIVIEGGHTVEATVNSSTGPANNVPVTFTIRDRGGQGDVIATAVENTNARGRAYYYYLDWVPGEQTIEARAEVNGAIYTDIARVTFINPCAATASLQGAPGAESHLQAMRSFRDSRLARSKRGREYSRLYYKFSSEAISLMMLNPMMVLRSREMIERYMPVVRDLAAGRSAVLTEGDLDEIDSFMNEFAASGSAELRETVKNLRRDLRDPESHRELGITIRPGARREMPSRGQLQGIRQMGDVTALLGLLLGGVFLIRMRRRKSLRRLLCTVLAASVSGIATGNRPLDVAAVRAQGDQGGPEYSAYLGGSGSDQATAVATDAQGNLYVAGTTDSTDLQTTSAAQPGFGGGAQDGFVAKFDPTGRQLIYFTYLGGSGNDAATGLAVDSSGNAYVTGFTTSTNFPTMSPLQPSNRGRHNGFVTKLGPTGNLVYSTYLGGNASDAGSGIAVDASGNAYVAGIATSANFPTVNAAQPNPSGGADVFVAKLNGAGNQLIYSTYAGGGQEDAATAIAVDTSGNAYVTGTTLSTDFRVVNAARPAHGGGIFDGFVVKLNSSGNQILYSTYLGGEGSDRGMRIAVDPTGAAYVTGDTGSADFPVRGAAQPSPGGSSDAFVTKLSANGGLAYSTYLGGSGIDGATAVSVDTSGAAYVTGYSGSQEFPAVGASQREFSGGEYDAFVVKLSASGAGLELWSWLGGSGLDTGYAIAAGEAGKLYVAGLTGSVDFPTANPLQVGYGGGASDVFIAQVRRGPTITAAAIQGKHLDITGSGFERGAVILLDGQQQKTKFRSSTSLRGKKLGKKIAAGDTVELQVRNPDGATSRVFSFTR